VGLEDFFNSSQWTVVDILKTEPRAAELYAVDDLPLAPASRMFLDQRYPNGIYRHQKEALRLALGEPDRGEPGENVCLVTGTASGKSLVFQTTAIDLLARDPQARVMAIYPMKALGNEQRDRWQLAMVSAGLSDPNSDQLIGRIDGNVPPGFRLNILERSRVVVFTPDIIHAWLFSNLNQAVVIEFLRNVKLIVVDEVHAYSGVFGSNAAFLFRRLQHLLALLDARPAFIGASATIANPAQHLRSLFGQQLNLVGPKEDSSPRHALDVYLVNPAGGERFLDEVVRLLEFLTHQVSARFIAFVDSRKQVELISSVLNRLLRENKADTAATAEAAAVAAGGGARRGGRARRAAPEPEPEADEPDPESEVTGVLQDLNVLPYRAGYEDHDRRQIQERLTDGTLNGVVSTSALELGIDIPNLDICVLIGAPASATSLQQRIGRIGRRGSGTVIVINGGDVRDSTVFANPGNFFARPLAESALYLENEHIQYIHVLCLARPGGEHDQVEAAAVKMGLPRKHAGAHSFPGLVEWPLNFLTLSNRERRGEAPRRLVSLKLEARDRPNYTFPLRDVESQFKVERREGPSAAAMGSLSFSQLMREAYPGAIYYYATLPYRVTRVNVKSKVVQVRREKRYTTQPQRTLPAVFPRLSPGGIFAGGQQGALVSIETSLLVRESISGVIEQRGRTENVYPYPLARELGFGQEQPFFSRNYFTTGVVLTHPALAEEGVLLEQVAVMLYEAFMLKFPFERQDIGFAADRFRVERGRLIQSGQPFLTVYDQTYGSLRLSSRLINPAALAQVLAEAAFLASTQESLVESPLSRQALAAMARAALHEPYQLVGFGPEAAAEQRDPDLWDRIIMPGSKGLMIRTNEEFYVQRILNTPAGLSYEGTPTSMLGSSASLMPLVTDVAEIPGESEMGWYDVATGTIEPAVLNYAVQFGPQGTAQRPVEIDPDWAARLLETYLDAAGLARLAGCLEVKLKPEKAAVIEQLLAACDPYDLLQAALTDL